MSGISNSSGPNAQTPLPFRFHFGPFQIESALDIPELRRRQAAHTHVRSGIAIRIVRGETPEDLPNAASFGKLCRVAPQQYLLNIPDVARFYVAHGREVVVQLAPRAAAADVSTFLLGSIFGALCHQNGLLPLHASAIEFNGEVTAFLGDSGAGKSTLAACLQGRGHRIVSDDICVLEPQAGTGAMRVVPVAGWLKLWRASLHHLGETPDERNRVYTTDDKYRLYLESDPSERPPIVNLIFLSKSASAAAAPRLTPLSNAETIGLMMQQTYLGYIVALTNAQQQNFRQCARVLEGARGFRMVVPWGFEHMEPVLDVLEERLGHANVAESSS
jgi:hypothetical protein